MARENRAGPVQAEQQTEGSQDLSLQLESWPDDFDLDFAEKWDIQDVLLEPALRLFSRIPADNGLEPLREGVWGRREELPGEQPFRLPARIGLAGARDGSDGFAVCEWLEHVFQPRRAPLGGLP